ncbi:MAG: radical SAM protein, partial [Deltaproteobacteria bacterium]|nr:radical SAM protein [Deltaproteobacteria bacterium]
DAIRRSILFDSRADILVVGMGERQIVNIARRLRAGAHVRDIAIPGTARIVNSLKPDEDFESIPSYDEIIEDRTKLLEAQLALQRAMLKGKRIVQRHGNRFIVDEPPETYGPSDLALAYDQDYSRAHLKPGVYSPALRMNLFSITSHRGCGGGCSFCSIYCHQGKSIISRERESILKEAHSLLRHPEWKGFVSDIGGPTAEMYGAGCNNVACLRQSCLFPDICRMFGNPKEYLELLRVCRKVKGVKKIFIGSGIRYDLLLQFPELLEEIMAYHSGSYLRVAPEHTEDSVLKLMGKPGFETFESFVRLFNSINVKLKRRVELAPYLITGHPGETWDDVVSMKVKLRSLGIKTTDVQVFTPSPGTLSTAMYYAESSYPYDHVPVVKDLKELMKRKEYIVN